MTVMYLIFGDTISYHAQAHLSMLTFKKQMDDTDRIVMVTTHPEFYRHADYVHVVPIDDAQVKMWQGEHQFFWRAKIKAIEHVGLMFPDDDLLYLDTDTFLFGPIQKLRRALKANKTLMDVDEGHPSAMKSKSLSMWKTVEGNTYSGVTLSQKHRMWTAGVVGIPRRLKEDTLQMALGLCDGMLESGAERVVIEQYSLSIALYEMAQKSRTRMLETKHVIGHYWANKGAWQKVANEMLLKSHFTHASLEDELKMLDDIQFGQIPVYVHRSHTAEKLKGIVAKLFPDRDHRRMSH